MPNYSESNDLSIDMDEIPRVRLGGAEVRPTSSRVESAQSVGGGGSGYGGAGGSGGSSGVLRQVQQRIDWMTNPDRSCRYCPILLSEGQTCPIHNTNIPDNPHISDQYFAYMVDELGNKPYMKRGKEEVVQLVDGPVGTDWELPDKKY